MRVVVKFRSPDGNPRGRSRGRYLTTAAKRRELFCWERIKTRPLPPGDLGGRGFPDPEIVPWVDRLNELPGVCTLQSCAGHATGNSAGLWIWLDRETAGRFDTQAFALSSMPGIEEVSRSYKAWGQEVVVVTFQGNERHLLAPSMAVILDFFCRLTTTGRSRPSPSPK